MPIQLRFKWKETHHPPYGQRNKSYLTCSFTQCRTKLLAHRETQKPELKYKRGSQLTGLLQAQAQHRTQLPIILNMQEYHTASIFPFHTEIHANLTSAKTLLCVSRSQMFTNVLNKNQHLWEQTFRTLSTARFKIPGETSLKILINSTKTTITQQDYNEEDLHTTYVTKFHLSNSAFSKITVEFITTTIIRKRS